MNELPTFLLTNMATEATKFSKLIAYILSIFHLLALTLNSPPVAPVGMHTELNTRSGNLQ